MNAAVGAFNIGTAAAGNTVSVTGVGFKPKAIIFWWSGRTSSSDGGGSSDVLAGIGVQAGPERWAASSFDADGGAAADNRAGHNVSGCIVQHSATAQTGLAEILTYDSDGFTLVIRTAFTVDYRIAFLALAGSDLRAYAGQFEMTSGTGNQAISVLPEQPTFLLLAGALDAASVGSVSAVDGLLSIGVATGASNRGVVAIGTDDGTNPVQAVKYGITTEIYADYNGTRASIVSRLDITSLDSDGFTINKVENGANRRINFLALAGVQAKVVSVTTRTDGNDIATASLGFTPVACLVLSHCGAANTADTLTDSVGAELSIGAATGASARISQAVSVQDNVTPAEGYSAGRADAIYINPDLADSHEGLMDVKSFDSDTITFVMDDTDPTGNLALVVAFGSGSGSTGSGADQSTGELMADAVAAGATSQSFLIQVNKTADGTGETGKVASDFTTAAYERLGEASVDISLTDLAAVTSSWSSGGIKEISSTKHMGTYRIDVPDAALVTTNSCKRVLVTLKTATGVGRLVIDLMADNPRAAASTTAQISDQVLADLHDEDFNGMSFDELMATNAVNISISGGVLTVKYHDGTVAFTRTLTREALAAIVSAAV